MRDTPRGIVEELREGAHLDAIELGVDETEMPGWEAADYVEHLQKALGRIRDGASDPVQVAAEALDPVKWMLSEPRSSP